MIVEVDEARPKIIWATTNIFVEKAQEFESIKGKQRGTRRRQRMTSRQVPRRPWRRKVQPKSSGGERRDLNKTQARLEKQVSRAESEDRLYGIKVKARELELADPALYKELGRWSELQQEQETWKKELERLTARWESLSEELQGTGKTDGTRLVRRLQRLFQIVIQPAVLFFRHQIIPHHAKQHPLLPGFGPGHRGAQLLLLLDAIGIQKRQRHGDLGTNRRGFLGMAILRRFVHVIEHRRKPLGAVLGETRADPTRVRTDMLTRRSLTLSVE